MQLMTLTPSSTGQRGSSLIEVLVAVLILSFGLLALGGMMSYAVQMPKLSAYRSSATSIAAAHVERMRANIAGYKLPAGTPSYASDSYSGEPHSVNVLDWQARQLSIAGDCVYPNCLPADLVLLDINETHRALRRELPGYAGIRVKCSGGCNSQEGDLWVLWVEPETLAALGNTAVTSNDECPAAADIVGSPLPSGTRCLHVRFKL